MGKGARRRKEQKKERNYEHQVRPKEEAAERRRLKSDENLRGEMEKWSEITQWDDRVIDPLAILSPHSRYQATKRRLQARLESPGQETGLQKVLDTYSAPLPNGYYVIVGGGAAAMVNHTTLRQSTKGKSRMAHPEDKEVGLPVLHIALPDPWLHYHHHGMGQPPYLLGLPGYHKPVPPDAAPYKHSCSSEQFAASTQAEWNLLSKTFASETFRVQGWVAAIETQKKKAPEKLKKALVDLGIQSGALETMLSMRFREGDPIYRLLVVLSSGELRFVFAHKIDLCSGAGKLRNTPRGFTPDSLPELLKKARTAPWLPPTSWTDELRDRLVVDGMDGLTVTTPFRSGQRICVFGSGGVGLNQMERAIDDGTYLDWVASGWMHANATFALKRNDTVLKKPRSLATEQDFMDPGEADAIREGKGPDDSNPPDGKGIKFRLIPGSKKLRIGQNAAFDKAESIDQGAKVAVEYKKSAQSIITDFYDRDINLQAESYFTFSESYTKANSECCGDSANGRAYDRLILCLGQDQTITGEPITIAGAFTFTPIVREGRAVGLENKADGKVKQGDIRILGSAATMFPRANLSLDDQEASLRAMETYRKSLPVSAVLPGFILNCCNIAWANDYFTDETPNTNANSASEGQLTALLTEKGQMSSTDAGKFAAKIIGLRSNPHDGFASMDDLVNRLAGDVTLAPKQTWEGNVRAALTTVYRAADPWD